jgi:ABC transporter substrate binding protein
MKRRNFIILLGCPVIGRPVVALAQEAGRIRRSGFLRVGPPPAAFIDGFRQGLRELGLVEGQHFAIEYSLAQSAAQVPDAAAELVRRKVDVIVASGTPSVLPARDAAGQTPVVFVATLDPVATGLVTSLARPVRDGGTASGHRAADRKRAQAARARRDIPRGAWGERPGGGRRRRVYRASCRDCGAGSQEPAADRFRAEGNGGGGRSHVLWSKLWRALSARGEPATSTGSCKA